MVLVLILVLTIIVLVIILIFVLILTILVLVLILIVLILVILVLVVLTIPVAAAILLLVFQHLLRIDVVLFRIHIGRILQESLLKGIDSPLPVFLGNRDISGIVPVVSSIGTCRSIVPDFLHQFLRFLIIFLTVQGVGQIIIGRHGCRILYKSLPVGNVRFLPVVLPEFAVSCTHVVSIDLCRRGQCH